MPDDFYNKEMDVPLQAPKWTLGGYKGSLKAAISDINWGGTVGVAYIKL